MAGEFIDAPAPQAATGSGQFIDAPAPKSSWLSQRVTEPLKEIGTRTRQGIGKIEREMTRAAQHPPETLGNILGGLERGAAGFGASGLMYHPKNLGEALVDMPRGAASAIIHPKVGDRANKILSDIVFAGWRPQGESPFAKVGRAAQDIGLQSGIDPTIAFGPTIGKAVGYVAGGGARALGRFVPEALESVVPGAASQAASYGQSAASAIGKISRPLVKAYVDALFATPLGSIYHGVANIGGMNWAAHGPWAAAKGLYYGARGAPKETLAELEKIGAAHSFPVGEAQKYGPVGLLTKIPGVGKGFEAMRQGSQHLLNRLEMGQRAAAYEHLVKEYGLKTPEEIASAHQAVEEYMQEAARVGKATDVQKLIQQKPVQNALTKTRLSEATQEGTPQLSFLTKQHLADVPKRSPELSLFTPPKPKVSPEETKAFLAQQKFRNAVQQGPAVSTTRNVRARPPGKPSTVPPFERVPPSTREEAIRGSEKIVADEAARKGIGKDINERLGSYHETSPLARASHELGGAFGHWAFVGVPRGIGGALGRNPGQLEKMYRTTDAINQDIIGPDSPYKITPGGAVADYGEMLFNLPGYALTKSRIGPVLSTSKSALTKPTTFNIASQIGGAVEPYLPAASAVRAAIGKPKYKTKAPMGVQLMEETGLIRAKDEAKPSKEAILDLMARTGLDKYAAEKLYFKLRSRTR